MKSFLCFFILGLFFSCPSVFSENQYNIRTVPNPKQKDSTAWVSNPNGIISLETQEKINRLIRSLYKENGIEIAVVLLNSIGNEEIKSFATDLFSEWSIGKRGLDNGLLILFVADQRKITFETGYGLEGDLPDAICKRIQMNDMIPYFKKEDYDLGILKGVEAIFQRLKGVSFDSEKILPLKQNRKYEIFFYYYGIANILLLCFSLYKINKIVSDKNKSDYEKYIGISNSFLFLKFLILLFPIIILPMLFYLKRKKHFLRENPIKCSCCGKNMRRLGEAEEDPYLSDSRILEESIGSVDYDVWLCEDCRRTHILRYDKVFSVYRECPRCHAKTFYFEGNYELQVPTHLHAGKGEKIYKCKYCSYTKSEIYTIPMLPPPVMISGGRGGGRGFGGGSFGGGTSGGGGSTSGW